MRRRDVVLSLAAGPVLMLLAVASPLSGFISRFIAQPALDLWFVGVAAIVGAVAVGRLGSSPRLARGLAIVGLTWISVAVSALGLLIALFMIFGPLGT